jgi:hypothetical protein
MKEKTAPGNTISKIRNCSERKKRTPKHRKNPKTPGLFNLEWAITHLVRDRNQFCGKTIRLIPPSSPSHNRSAGRQPASHAPIALYPCRFKKQKRTCTFREGGQGTGPALRLNHSKAGFGHLPSLRSGRKV